MIIIRKLYYSLSFWVYYVLRMAFARTHTAIVRECAAPGFKFNFVVQDEWATDIANYLVSAVSNFLPPSTSPDTIPSLSRFYSPCNHVNGRNVLHEASREHTKKRHNFVCSVVPSIPVRAVLSAFILFFLCVFLPPKRRHENQKVFFIAFNFSRCFL